MHVMRLVALETSKPASEDYWVPGKTLVYMGFIVVLLGISFEIQQALYIYTHTYIYIDI